MNIWIVDDSEADQVLYRKVLKEHVPNGEFRSFFMAEDAVDAVLEGEFPSLVLLDLRMPGLGGMHFLAERQSRALMEFPVVVVSASDHPEDVKRTYALGANSYFQKPTSLTSFQRIATAVVEYWHQWSRLPILGG